MTNSKLGTNAVAQIGVVVHDIETASRAYAELLGIEPPAWFWTDAADKAKTEYGGAPSEARAKLAFIDLGPVQLELIEPDGHPSTWRDHLNARGEGVHHLAFVVEKMKDKIDALEKHGIPLQQKGEYTGGRYAYMDSSRALKVLLELLENDR
ncbi:VOC family protein [Paenibacillus sp. MWE-103]|uniref:VOC family protein n=1 Tax=Paenibacillus artemisiicola TaxID=1172618 RepID=A0ABS3WC73_9BACL|nr:VOC family protein [Paenibacillus artemisiicola]MBO7745936.1 VOC family protein [Paenibacillus artemisiicola]